MVFVYVLELDQKKYYIGKTETSKFRIDTHFDSKGSSFTKKYPPKEIYQIIPECDKYDEDKYVKKYMDKYGIENVRGGSYTKLVLSNTEIKFIQRELLEANNNYENIYDSDEFDNNKEEDLSNEESKYIKYYEDELFELDELVDWLGIFCV